MHVTVQEAHLVIQKLQLTVCKDLDNLEINSPWLKGCEYMKCFQASLHSMKSIADSTLYYLHCKSKKNIASLRVNAIERIHPLNLIENRQQHSWKLLKTYTYSSENT